MAVQIPKLIRSLNWCCVYAFFRCYKQTGLIASRLGVSERAVRYRKEQFRCGELVCEKLPNCKLTAIRRAGR